jgi:non-specific serine/threonine protein kinase
VGHALLVLGNTAYNQGDLAASRRLLEQGLAIQRAMGDRRGVAWTAGVFGRTLAAAGEYEAARPLIEEEVAIFRENGDRLGLNQGLWFLANLAFDQGNLDEARAPRREALALLRELDDWHDIGAQLESFGEAAAAAGDAERALRLAGAAAALRAADGRPPTAPEQARLDRWLERVAAGVSSDVRASAWAEGQGMTREDAVAYALADAPSTPPGPPGPPAGLTPREIEVLRLVAQGKTDRQIAADLIISEKTVGRHLDHLYTKLGVSSRAAATSHAVRAGLA